MSVFCWLHNVFLENCWSSMLEIPRSTFLIPVEGCLSNRLDELTCYRKGRQAKCRYLLLPYSFMKAAILDVCDMVSMNFSTSNPSTKKISLCCLSCSWFQITVNKISKNVHCSDVLLTI